MVNPILGDANDIASKLSLLIVARPSYCSSASLACLAMSGLQLADPQYSLTSRTATAVAALGPTLFAEGCIVLAGKSMQRSAANGGKCCALCGRLGSPSPTSVS